MSPSVRERSGGYGRVWLLVILAFWGAAIYHAAAIVVPGMAGGVQAWRHGVFALIDAAVAASLAYRPPWLPPAFAILTCQVIYSHGGHGWHVLATRHRVAWFHWGVTLVVIIVLVMLIYDGYCRKADRNSRDGQ